MHVLGSAAAEPIEGARPAGVEELGAKAVLLEEGPDRSATCLGHMHVENPTILLDEYRHIAYQRGGAALAPPASA